MPSIDHVLAISGKPLKRGESVIFTLVKGNETTSQDPLDPSAPAISFPAMAKFGLSVEKPDLSMDYRMFEQKVPEAKDDSDDEDFAANAQEASTRRKRRRAPKLPRREWIYEPENEFQEEIGNLKNKGDQDFQDEQKKTKLRYVGTPENNTSSYVTLSVDLSGQNVLRVTPVSGFYSFQQPGKTHTLSMQEAENMINDQRATTTRYMMRAKAAAAGIASAPAMSMVRPDKGSTGLSRIRLLGKLSNIGGVGSGQAQEEDDDDVMSDLKFKSRKKGSRARQELISTLGDGLAVDDDGVLGGANDNLFGGRRNFSRIAQSVDRGRTESGAPNNEKGSDQGGGSSKQVAESAEGAAMSDDFFQRDVGAEYDQLDFDANEQFDDDDVDQVEDNEGGGGFVNDDEDDDLDEEDDDEGLGGLASVAGLKALMAKAGGEQSSPDDKVNPAEVDSRGRKTTAYNIDSPTDTGEDPTGSESKDQAPDSDEHGERQGKKARVGKPLLASKGGDALGIDAQGNRIISLESVRREIWLHHGQIKTKQLLKIFNVKKRSAEQKKFFNELVKELCTMSKTVEGNVLVLKQHYAK